MQDREALECCEQCCVILVRAQKIVTLIGMWTVKVRVTMLHLRKKDSIGAWVRDYVMF